jgi:hypothetical protein
MMPKFWSLFALIEETTQVIRLLSYGFGVPVKIHLMVRTPRDKNFIFEEKI